MCSSSKDKRNGFTLLEVILAVCLLALVGVSMYRFVETTLTAARVARASERDRALVTAIVQYLRTQMLAIPAVRAGAISGEPHRFNNVPSDELRWIARPGSGLLTRHASGEWQVTLTARQVNGGQYELGMRRQDVEGSRDATWLPLFGGVRGFEVRYFDAARKEWMEKWTDPQTRPALIRIKLWRDPDPEAYEMVLPIPGKVQPMGGAV